MTSILTNSSALSAASALAATQRSLATTQQQLSTALRVSSAKDDPAYWSIAQGMQSRIGTLKAVNDGLSLTSTLIGITSAALDAIRVNVQDIERLVLEAQTAGVDKTALQTEIGLRQKAIVTTAEAASFNGVNWLVTRMSGSDVTREDVTNQDPQAAYTPSPSAGHYTSETRITETKTTTQTLGSTSSGITAKTIINTYTPDPTQTQEVFGASDSTTTSGDPLGYRNAGILFSPDVTTQIDLHPIELFKSFVGTTQSTAYESFSDVPSFQYANNPNVISESADPYLTSSMDDDLDTPIALSDQTDGLSTVLNLNVATAKPTNLRNLYDGVDRALSAVVSGQSFLGSLATSVTNQQAANSSLVDALGSGVGSLVDADMNQVSTRLTALETQEHLGLQALGVANTDANVILRLFDGR